jgi:hypothetical protein
VGKAVGGGNICPEEIRSIPFVFNMKQAGDTAAHRLVTFGTLLALLKCIKASQKEKIQKIRSNPMKVKTNTKAGDSALWGS